METIREEVNLETLLRSSIAVLVAASLLVAFVGHCGQFASSSDSSETSSHLEVPAGHQSAVDFETAQVIDAPQRYQSRPRLHGTG